MCCIDKTIEARPAGQFEGGCIFCEYPNVGTDIWVIERGNGGMLIRLCRAHRIEIGKMRG